MTDIKKEIICINSKPFKPFDLIDWGKKWEEDKHMFNCVVTQEGFEYSPKKPEARMYP
jgi:hypothetical protein